MSMRCKHCAESFPKGQPHDMWEFRRQHMSPADVEGMTTTASIEDAGVFCSRKCLTDYLKAGDQSGVFDLRSRR
jgi:hypothetical protein